MESHKLDDTMVFVESSIHVTVRECEQAKSHVDHGVVFHTNALCEGAMQENKHEKSKKHCRIIIKRCFSIYIYA